MSYFNAKIFREDPKPLSVTDGLKILEIFSDIEQAHGFAGEIREGLADLAKGRDEVREKAEDLDRRERLLNHKEEILAQQSADLEQAKERLDADRSEFQQEREAFNARQMKYLEDQQDIADASSERFQKWVASRFGATAQSEA
jgi:DNA repair exonuclease SbcCD ATPase subunit